MTWQCRLIECTPGLNGTNLQIGDMFLFDDKTFPLPEFNPDDPDADDPYYWFRRHTAPHKVSDYYKQHNSHRPLLFVWLPGRTLFCVDSKCWKTDVAGGKIEYYGGWAVTGDAPNITVHPSINVGGSYHGWLQNGVIGDDVEGRKFDADGRQIR